MLRARARAVLRRTGAAPTRSLSSAFEPDAAAGAYPIPADEDILPHPRPETFPPVPGDPRDFFRFEIIHESPISRARVGRLHTPNGVVDTPAFVAVGTNAALKAVDQRCAR